MTSFFMGLNESQRIKALSYRGPEDHGDPKFLRHPSQLMPDVAKASFTDGNGTKVTPPDRVEYRFGARRGRLVEVFPDGDAYVAFDDAPGTELVKWHHLCKVVERVEQ